MSHVVLQINLSNTVSIAGRMQITTTVLITAPLAKSVVIELIMSMLEYAQTPNVAAKKLIPLMIIDLIEVLCAIATASFFVFLFTTRSLWYLVVINIA